MANSGLGQNATVEEILASIRQAISEDDAKRTLDRNRSAQSSRAARRPVVNVSGVFGESESEPAEENLVDEQDADAAATDPSPDRGVIDLAIEQALEGVRAELEGTKVTQSRFRPRQAGEVAARLAQRAIPRATRATALRREVAARPVLLSHRVDAQVSASFDDLAKAMIEGNARKLDEVVEDLLRPMLKNWLEGNLPQMVERLVREEIERVSRGRR